MFSLTRRDAGKALLTGCAALFMEGRRAMGGDFRQPAPVRAGGLDQRTSSATVEQAWSDVLLVDGAEPVVSYRTGWVVYEESLTNGQWVGRGWNGAGYINFYDGRVKPDEQRMPEAFRLEIDGQSMVNAWKWGGLKKTTGEDGQLHVVVTLIHGVRPVSVKVHTQLDGTAVVTRWLEIINTGAKPAALASVSSWSGVLRKNEHWSSHLGASHQALYSLGYFEETDWGCEDDFHWHELPAAGYRVEGRYRRGRYRQPFFTLRNNATGEFFIGELAWSGGYSLAFDLDEELDHGQSAAMTFAAGPDAPAPLRILAPGESAQSPEMHLGLVFGDLDAAVQAMHAHLRKSVFVPPARGHRGWIVSGIGPEVEITVDQVNHAIDVAAEFGAEIFFIDATWYAPPQGDWWKTVGDWEVNRQRFPEGLKPFRERAHAAGLLWGLWMDAERVGAESRVAREHPDWLAMNYNGKREMGGLLDLTRPDTAHWMEEQIAAVIEKNELDFFRLDYNTDYSRGIEILRDGYVENGYWRYYEALYAIYDRLRARFPKVIFENCAGGGGRTDIGMVRHFDHTDATDWQIAPRSFSITNGITMALPPECVDRLVGGQNGQSAADFDFQSRLLMFLDPKFAFLYPIGAQPNPVFMARLKHYVDLYKNFVRPYLETSRIYHHTPEVFGRDPQGWGVLELASADCTHSLCGVFQLSAPTESFYCLYPRGIDLSRRYKVTFDNLGEAVVMDGIALIESGLTVRLETALTSEMILFEAV